MVTDLAPEPVGVIGGSGFYALFDDAEDVDTTTPYGPPSGTLTRGTLAGRDVVFVPRHGPDHRFAPHVVPYQANLWALRSLGVRQVISLSAVGSLTPALPLGTLVAPDQIADRTSGRAHTFFGAGAGVWHAAFADPYCPRGHDAAVATPSPAEPSPAAPSPREPSVHDGGTLVVVNGPRFSSRAESLEFQSHGWSIIGMTAMPEAGLARELALCYTTLALVTDLDAGVEAGSGVTHAEVLREFGRNLPRLRDLLVSTLARLPARQGDCPCGDAAGYPASFVLP